MPIKETKFVKSLKKRYGSRWQRVYYAFRNKYPSHPAVLEAEGKGKLKRLV